MSEQLSAAAVLDRRYAAVNAADIAEAVRYCAEGVQTELTPTWGVFTATDGLVSSIARYETADQVPSA